MVKGQPAEAKGDTVAVFALVDSGMIAVDHLLTDILTRDDQFVSELADHLLRASGKRLRPALVLLAGQFGTAYSTGVLERVAAGVELIHMATLIHDDIIDDAALRRGVASVKHQFGNTVAVLAGDYLFARAFQLFASVPDQRVMAEAADVVGVMCAGEIRQYLDQGRIPSEAAYLRRIEAKTARFLESSCRLGAMAGGVEGEAVEFLARFGHDIGMAFQIVDDLLDWSTGAERLGKSVGEDIAHGVFTLPIIYARSVPGMRQEVDDYLSLEGGPPLNAMRGALERSGALEYARARAAEYIRAGRQALAELPPAAARVALEELAAFVVSRDH